MLKEIRSLNEECGVFGVFGVEDASEYAHLGLQMLQHRGQDGAGIITYDNSEQKYHKHKDFGLVTQVFSKETLKELKGTNAIAHVRYATSGGSEIENIQPFLFYRHDFSFSLCHNGNIINSKQIKQYLEKKGSIFQSNSDSEILAHLIMKNYAGDFIEALKESLNLIEGAFSFLILYNNKLYAMRDTHGLRPLSIAKLDEGYAVASETCAFDLINAKFMYDIKPGQIIEISDNEVKAHKYALKTENKMCAMEYIYFAKADSYLEGKAVYDVRFETGKELAKEAKIDADIVIGVPDSSLAAAVGYANAAKIPYEIGLIRNKYVGRTFIEPTQDLREKLLNLKLSVIKSVVKDKRIILVDDSIVRGTTSKRIVKLLKETGAKEVHVVIASPMLTGVCFYGVDIHTEEELIAYQKNQDEIKDYIEADSLHYLSLSGLKKVLKDQDICHGCFDKNYPTYLYNN